MIINIRGTNGSGKTTLARSFQSPDARVEEVLRRSVLSPTKKDPNRMVDAVVTAVVSHVSGVVGEVASIGSYVTAQGGLDTVGSFELQQEAVMAAAKRWPHVICEGVLASTVYGSWAVTFGELARDGYDVLVAYLDTPVETCLARIRERQERAGKVREIKEDQVRDKVRAINATRDKFAKLPGITVVDLPHREAWPALLKVMADREPK